MNERTKALIRLFAVTITWINAMLVAKGINPLPFDETEAAEFASYIVSIAAAFWAWWKHTNWTTGAQVVYPDIKQINSISAHGGETNELDPACMESYEAPEEDFFDEEEEVNEYDDDEVNEDLEEKGDYNG